MGTNETNIATNTLYSLQLKQPAFIMLNEIKADLFNVERVKTSVGRKLFQLHLQGPLIIPSFPSNNDFDLAISPHSELQLKVIESQELVTENGYSNKATLLNNSINCFSDYFSNRLKPEDLSVVEDKDVYLEAGKVYGGTDTNSVRWITGLPGGSRFLDEVELNDTTAILPFTEHIWYKAGGPASVKIYETEELLNNQQQVSQLFTFTRVLNQYFQENLKKDTDKKLKQVQTSFSFRKSSEKDAFGLLGKTIVKTDDAGGVKTVKSITDDGVQHVDEKLLLETCQLIGNYEKIIFKPGFKSKNSIDDPLKHILRTSNIRARKVFLDEGWWKNNHGALLGYLKSGRTPVALIPAGHRSYKLLDIAGGQKLKVDSVVTQSLLSEAQSFFTPFPPGSLNAKDLFKFALQFTKSDLILFLVVGVIGALLAVLVPVISGYAFNNIIPGGKTAELLSMGLILLFTVVTIGILNFVKSLAILRFEGTSSYKLQSALWDRILSLKVPFFSQYNPGDLAERSLGIEKIRTTLSANVMGAISSGIFSIFYLLLLFFYDVRLALLALVLGLAVAIFTLTISLLAYKHVAFQRRMEAIISGFMMMVIRGISKIRITGSKEKVFYLWADKFAQQKKHYVEKQYLLVIADVFSFTFPILASLLIYLRIYNLLTNDFSSFEIGDFVAFNTAYLFFQGALINTFMVTVPLMSIKPTYEMFKPILDADLEEYDNKIDPGALDGRIEVTKLSFKYKESPDWILRDINFKINPGEFVALAGSSGSGKSTLYRILLGFEQYQEGSVLFGRNELKELDIRTVRDQLGVVLQSGKIMQGSVLYNIVGTSNYTEEDAWKAARMAGCDKDIEDMPLKMHTILPPGGGTLSGGQQQRIMIARALVRKPRILLFDEATSALDNETQQIVSDNIEKLKATRIVIAHRLSTIIHADRILVMDKGKIVEEGTFEELTKMNGFFQNLVKSQLA